MQRSTGNRRWAPVLSVAVVLAAWQLLTLLYPPLVVPTISAVAAELAAIAGSAEAWRTILQTALRLAAGLGAGIAAGTAMGILLGCVPFLLEVFRPLIGLVQSVPPVSWLVLALIWFGFDGTPSVFIVAVGTAPIMAVTVIEGMRNIDVKLLQMAALYRFSRRKRLTGVIVPSVLPYFRAGLQLAIGIGSKTVVMGEVLTTSSGIGGEITDARLNIEPEGIVAWTVVVVVLYYLLDKLAATLLRDRKGMARDVEDSRPEKKLWESGRLGRSEPGG